MMKRTVIVLLVALCSTLGLSAKRYTYTVEKIWDQNLYCAFTDIEKFNGWYYVAFREARGHVFDENGKAEGKIRVIRSRHLRKWESVALLGMPDMDFRDPKLSITPNGQLLVSIGVSIYVNRQFVSRAPWAALSCDGIHFDMQQCVLDGCPGNDWPWRTTWHDGTGYNVDYYLEDDESSDKAGLALLTTKDGVHYTRMCNLDVPGVFPNEATIRFREDGTMAIMVRCEGGNQRGLWGMSQPPYTQWEWKEMPFKLGGPDFVFLDNDKVVCGSRCHHIGNWCTTSLYTGNADGTCFHQVMTLPSGGDTSYPGMMVEDGTLIMTYYAGHETHWPSIYLARIPLDCLE